MRKLKALICVLVHDKIVIGWDVSHKYGFNVIEKRFEIDCLESLPIPD